MGEIKCLENYKTLKIMFEKGEVGDTVFFAKRLNVSERTIHRLIKYLRDINDLSIKHNKYGNYYYLETK